MDIRVVELLCSRICHDLVSPVGAIRNGLELVDEMEGDAESGFLGEAVKLIAHSAGQAGRRLRLFRLAYGVAGRDVKGYGEVRTIAAEWLEGGRARLDWPAGTPPDVTAARPGLAKTVLNLVVLADEALSHGGEIAVAGEGDAAGGRITVAATGRIAAHWPELALALAGGIASDDLSPRTIHAHVAGRFAEAFGLAFSAAPAGAQGVAFRLDW